MFSSNPLIRNERCCQLPDPVRWPLVTEHGPGSSPARVRFSTAGRGGSGCRPRWPVPGCWRRIREQTERISRG